MIKRLTREFAATVHPIRWALFECYGVPVIEAVAILTTRRRRAGW